MEFESERLRSEVHPLEDTDFIALNVNFYKIGYSIPRPHVVESV